MSKNVLMQYISGILVVIHLIGFAVLMGATLALLPRARKGKGFIPEMMFHGLVLVFLSGIFLVALALGQGGLQNIVATLFKIAIVMVLVVMMVSKRKSGDIGAGFFAWILALTAFNVAISIL